MKKRAYYLLLVLVLPVLLITCSQKDEDAMPVANFNLQSNEVYVGEEVVIANTSQNAEYYSWDFGDESTSTEFNPVHVYNAPGDYTITLRAINKALEDTHSKTIKILSKSNIQVTTVSISNLSANTATSGGNIVNNSDQEITAKGVCWSVNENPTIDDFDGLTNEGTGNDNFVSNIDLLEPVTTYYIKAYVIANNVTIYGNQIEFTTLNQDANVIVEEGYISEIYANGIEYNGNVIVGEGANVNEIGFCWNTSGNPTVNSNTGKVVAQVSEGLFVEKVDNMEFYTGYALRAYAITPDKVIYGKEIQFTTNFATHNYTPKSLNINYTNKPPIIDGEIDDLWSNFPAHEIDRLKDGPVVTLGAGARFKATWDDSYLYVIIIVPDDKFLTESEAATEYWQADRTSVYFDVNEILDDGFGPNNYNTGHYEITNNSAEMVWNGSETGGDMNQMAFAEASNGNYIVEYAVSFDAMVDNTGSQLNPYERRTIGFDVMVNDKDDPALAWDKFGTINWSNSVNNIWFNMDNSGFLTFVGGNSQPNEIVIIDPATINPVDLPDGITITEINGEKYLQAIINLYETRLVLPTIGNLTGMNVHGDVKYALGQKSIEKGYSLKDIQNAVSLQDTINLIDNPWGEGQIPSEALLWEETSTGELLTRYAVINDPMANVHEIVFSSMKNNDWIALAGDTIWCGKIIATSTK